MTKEINNYLQGKLSEEAAIKLWARLIADDRAYLLLELFILLNKIPSKSEQIEIPESSSIL